MAQVQVIMLNRGPAGLATGVGVDQQTSELVTIAVRQGRDDVEMALLSREQGVWPQLELSDWEILRRIPLAEAVAAVSRGL